MAEEATAPDDRWRTGLPLMQPAGWPNDSGGPCQHRDARHASQQPSPGWPHDGKRCLKHFKSEGLVHWRHRDVAIHQGIPDGAGAPDGEDGAWSVIASGRQAGWPWQ